MGILLLNAIIREKNNTQLEQMEYYVLVGDYKILGVFTTLLECLTWKTNVSYKEMIIHRVCKNEKNIFTVQQIVTSPHIFMTQNSSLDDLTDKNLEKNPY